MVARTYRIYGEAYSDDGGPVAVTVKFNNVQVLNTTVPANQGPAPIGRVELSEILLQFEADHTITGTVPVEISAHDGEVIAGLIEANYSGAEVQLPIPPGTTEWPFIIAPENFWLDCNENSEFTDGKADVKLDGSLINDGHQTRNIDAGDFGDASFRIPPGSTLDFDLFVDPARVLAPPYPPVPQEGVPPQP